MAMLGMPSMVFAASLTQVSNWGNPVNGVSMYIYVPDRVATKPPVIVAIHPCGGSAQEYFSLTRLPSYADSFGFILIYPQTTKDQNCWDCYSSASNTHNGGSDSKAIAAMVSYTLGKYNGDASKVFSVGSSSGAMMTPILMAAYPDVFAGGAGFSGVPAGCFENATSSTPSTPDQSCPHAQKGFTAQQWGDIARAEYPGYTGQYPKMQVWEGTADTLVTIGNLQAQLDQWSNVMGLSFSHNETNTPQSGYTKIVYGDGTRLVGYSAAGVGHFVPFHETDVLDFFDLLGGTSTSSSTQPSGPTSTTGGGGGPSCTAAHWAQCGGMGYSGCTVCASPYSCQVSNAYYSQCL
ncbi:carbohydrate esterase family 1 protein [Trichoderma atroviride IMI 206040]|uniref:Carboxylic ester hydrolase n=1 Tax=Hypocrea atroviridis (strain ATCC 20476 / IMI 206040) TaxID=452589 RepID=G9NSZ2_HYPAI|nr:carbohydrate esterase family 1 protein [Trichoderma atroviride IMI 206040]EHK46536.1 carbohydrate esterase family 1 protein [Trichoderma atroviride IMI 206040]